MNLKKRTRKTVLLLMLFILSAIMSVTAVGCEKNDVFTTEYFRCMFNDDKTEVTILELTKEGQRQEILVIPEKIAGRPVVQLGGKTKGYPYQVPHYIKSNSLKKIYLDNSNFLNIENFDISQPIEIIALKNNSYIQTVFSGNRLGGKFSCYTLEKIFNENEERLQARHKDGFSVISTTNMNFIEVTDTGETIIWADNISDGNVYWCPFWNREWYVDKECTALWDRKYSISDNEETLNVFCKKMEEYDE